ARDPRGQDGERPAEPAGKPGGVPLPAKALKPGVRPRWISQFALPGRSAGTFISCVRSSVSRSTATAPVDLRGMLLPVWYTASGFASTVAPLSEAQDEQSMAGTA